MSLKFLIWSVLVFTYKYVTKVLESYIINRFKKSCAWGSRRYYHVYGSDKLYSFFIVETQLNTSPRSLVFYNPLLYSVPFDLRFIRARSKLENSKYTIKFARLAFVSKRSFYCLKCFFLRRVDPFTKYARELYLM